MWRCAGFIKPATHTDEETAKCPEPLCPTLVLPPLGRRNFHLLRGRYPPVIALTGSCATPHGLSHPFGIQPRSKSLCRLYSVPAAHGSFPTLSLKIFPWMLDPVPRRSHRVLYGAHATLLPVYSAGDGRGAGPCQPAADSGSDEPGRPQDSKSRGAFGAGGNHAFERAAIRHAGAGGDLCH